MTTSTWAKWLESQVTPKPMSAREIEALVDIKNWYKGNHPPRGSYQRYAWKPGTMRKLQARGLVKHVGESGGQPLWELTDLGNSAP
jgi:hypothetical protein